MLEAIGLVAGLNDVAMMRQPIQRCRGQLGIFEHATPLGEGQIGGGDDAGSLSMLSSTLLDDWGLAPMDAENVRDLLEIIDDWVNQ